MYNEKKTQTYYSAKTFTTLPTRSQLTFNYQYICQLLSLDSQRMAQKFKYKPESQKTWLYSVMQQLYEYLSSYTWGLLPETRLEKVKFHSINHKPSTYKGLLFAFALLFIERNIFSPRFLLYLQINIYKHKWHT